MAVRYDVVVVVAVVGQKIDVAEYNPKWMIILYFHELLLVSWKVVWVASVTV